MFCKLFLIKIERSDKMSVIAYFDESGDDGIINYSSKTFILTAFYMHASNWNENYELIKKFRQYLKEKY